jgi:hypothetical protein
VLSRGPGDALVDMAVRLFGAETVSLGGVQASNTLGHGPKEGIQVSAAVDVGGQGE